MRVKSGKIRRKIENREKYDKKRKERNKKCEKLKLKNDKKNRNIEGKCVFWKTRAKLDKN